LAAPAVRIRDALRVYAFAFPAAYEDAPWGESVAKVGKKIFAFFSPASSGVQRLTVKLPASRDAALGVPGSEPTGYGLGKSGWVTVPLDRGVPPLEVLREWLEESYRAVAPKKLAAQLDARLSARSR
jgi:predicted DNA-binding protein (MmcQ/YjbR family)